MGRLQSTIHIQPNPLKVETIRIKFDSEEIFVKWFQVFRENSKSDEELINNICIVPDYNVNDKKNIKYCGDVDLSYEPPILEFE
jgi:hypothetical protein